MQGHACLESQRSRRMDRDGARRGLRSVEALLRRGSLRRPASGHSWRLAVHATSRRCEVPLRRAAWLCLTHRRRKIIVIITHFIIIIIVIISQNYVRFLRLYTARYYFHVQL